jgi:hypothetical protein
MALGGCVARRLAEGSIWTWHALHDLVMVKVHMKEP